MPAIGFGPGLTSPYALPPGAVVSVPFFGGIHLGLVSDQSWGGYPLVLNNSKTRGRVVEEDWLSFIDNRPVTFQGYPSELDSAVVLDRARTRIGQKWNLRHWNCEHFVRWAHGLPAESEQVDNYLSGLAIFGTIARLAQRLR